MQAFYYQHPHLMEEGNHSSQQARLRYSPAATQFSQKFRLGQFHHPQSFPFHAANGDAPITYFEITTVAGLLAMSRTPADYTLLEVGLGGRLDATNVINTPALTVITPVSFDHPQFLGDTVAKIASEKAGIIKPIGELTFFELNKRTQEVDFPSFLQPIAEGKNVGVLSEAGCPGIADPGADIVNLAQRLKIKVVPLVGPSSILLALMASGFNGQSFCFNGYLPKDQKERSKKLKDLERLVKTKQQTQLFIETPFRNTHVFEDLLENCFGSTKLCVAVDITLPSEKIITKTIEDWKKTQINLQKRPCIFLIG